MEQADRCRRIAEDIDEPSMAAALRGLAEEYARKAEALPQPDQTPEATEASASDPAQERALAILREFEDARVKLVGRGVILTDGKAGTIDRVFLDELHGLRISLEGHEGNWPISTVKLSEV